jgi:hypothetical protein
MPQEIRLSPERKSRKEKGKRQKEREMIMPADFELVLADSLMQNLFLFPFNFLL